MRTIGIITTALFAIALAGCDNSGQQAPFEMILKSPNGHFRGIDIGAPMSGVMKSEGVQPAYEEKDKELHYNFAFGEVDSFTISYSFDEKGLYEVLLNAYLENPDDVSDLFNQFKAHYTTAYGNTEDEQEGYASWLISSGHSKEIEISILDETMQYGQGKFAISIYDYDY